MKKPRFKIIQLEEGVILHGFGTKEQAFILLHILEGKWGCDKTEDIDELKPMYELTITSRYSPDSYYSWKDKPFTEDGYEHRLPVGYVITY